MAEKAGKAAPAMAIAGVLVASPQAQHAITKPTAVAAAQASKPTATHEQIAAATLESIASHASVGTATTRRAAATPTAKNTYYKVRAGDTLSAIAGQYYHDASDWPWLYHENDKTVQDPNLIYTGQVLLVPGYVPKHAAQGGYVPRHSKPAAQDVTSVTGSHSGSGRAAVTRVTGQGMRSGGSSGGSPTHWHSRWGGGSGKGVLSGQLGCSGLEQLWEEAGGNPADAFIAAEIAMAESGGNQYALSPTDDYGYWQINVSNGALATFDAYGNARAAVIISQDGTDWYPWTTYTSGAYIGRC